MAVGPTLRFKAGDVVAVTLRNNLDANPGATTTMNTMHSPGTTNLHTHGLHVDADDPQDNVFVAVAPGASHAYKYNIVGDHMGGTHWYHAHFHGNTALHVGGGLVGMLIVDDAADEIPGEIASLPEIALMVQKFEPRAVQTLAAAFQDGGDGWSQSGNSGLVDGDSYWMVNGQYNPTATVEAGQWTRVRIAYSSLEAPATVALSDANSLGCEWKLLAKDGVYVKDAPRALTVAHFAPGNRADVVVKCIRAGAFTFTATAVAAGPGGGGGGGGGGPGGPGGKRRLLQTTETLLTFSVTASVKTAVGALTTFTAKKPEYLADVYDLSAVRSKGVTVATHNLNIQASPGACMIAFDTTSKLYDGTSHGSMVSGTVQEWDLRGNDRHPFHIHINSFQLGADANDPDGYYETGDWHDVFYRPATVTAGKIYFSVDQHTGKAVLHCHFLEHEDKGCMGYIDITGTEGATTGLGASALVGGAANTSAAGPSSSPTAAPQSSISAAAAVRAIATVTVAALTLVVLALD